MSEIRVNNEVVYDGKDMYVNGLKQDMDDYLSFQEFEAIYATIKSMIQITAELFHFADSLDRIPKGLYTEIIRLHNAAVDYMEAYKNLIDKEENNDLHKKNKETE